jgi:trehalose monomycolate/heme transporter
MFGWWGRVVVRTRWWVLAATAVLVLVGGAWGTGIFGMLAGGGFDDPGSDSSRAQARLSQVFGQLGPDVDVLYTSPTATVDDAGLADPVRAVIARISGRPEVAEVTSYYAAHIPTYVSSDRHSTYIGIQLNGGGQGAKLDNLAAIRPLLQADGVETVIGGNIVFVNDANTQVQRDVERAELISLPVLLVLLILIFRGLIAAATPLVVGVVAILGAFTVTRVLVNFTEVSVFAANVITLLGLGMAIDYALFVVSRFREELAAGHDTPTAVSRTMRTAGRTVVVSGVIVALALSSLLLFPLDFLRSLGYGGMAAVLVAMLAALTTLPALLAVLGPRINALRIPLPRRRRAAPTAASAEAPNSGGWDRLARSVMRRPIPYVVLVAAILLSLATPFLRAQFGGFDERVLPAGTPSRTVAEALSTRFPDESVAPVIAVISGASVQAAGDYAVRAAALPRATGAAVIATKGDTSLVQITFDGEPESAQAREVVTAVRALAAPPGAEVLVTGRSAFDLDQIDSLKRRLPWMVLYVFAVTFVLLFLAFGSVVLPVKAIIMNIISIGASFGVVVWVFQDGHLAEQLGFTATGFLAPTNLVLMLAVLFGLSTDYEVFLLSRVREEWLRTGDNTEAVATGLQRTGGIITAAAFLLIIVVSGFATGGVQSIKLLGVGTVVAVAVDAALVRTLLVPATMRLLGRWNWWAPGPLARLHRRIGLRESDEMAEAPRPEAVRV